MKNYKLLSAQQKRDIPSLQQQGYTYSEIAEKVGCSISTVSRIINKDTEPRPYKKTSCNSVVTEYIPDYRRTIRPQKLETKYCYGSLIFTIDFEERQLTINLSEQLETIYDLQNIEDLKQFGETIVGIASSFMNLIVDKEAIGYRPLK